MIGVEGAGGTLGAAFALDLLAGVVPWIKPQLPGNAADVADQVRGTRIPIARPE